jgi:hypothetical protein
MFVARAHPAFEVPEQAIREIAQTDHTRDHPLRRCTDADVYSELFGQSHHFFNVPCDSVRGQQLVIIACHNSPLPREERSVSNRARRNLRLFAECP